jgi:methylmalonyl-CoA/ethylmalonyl-CoA epimerase
MQFDHIGVFCKNLEIGKKKLSEILPIVKSSKIFKDPLLKVSVQFLFDNNNICYELVAPNGVGNPVDLVLKKNTLNHIAYKVSNFNYIIKKYRKLGCMPLSTPKKAVAFHGARVIFFLTPLNIIVELIEIK